MMHDTEDVPGGTRPHGTAGETHTGRRNVEALMGLIEETVAVHLRLQILTEELHGHSELSRACRGILQDLYRLGPRTVPQLARGRPGTRQNVLMLVKRLVAEEMTEFIRNPDHKRSHLARLTPRGKALLEEMWGREAALLNSLEHDLSVEDLHAATDVLHRLRAALETPQRDEEVTSG